MTPSLPLRLSRATRHFRRFRGLSALLKVYRKLIPTNSLFRVDDFDGDIKLDVSVRETIGINIWHSPDQYEKRERDLFCSAIRPGSIVLDIGANIGIYTLLAAKRGATVFSIEPDPDSLLHLRRHVEMNGFFHRVSIMEMAATESQRPVTLYKNPANSGGSTLFGSGRAISVLGKSIDSLDLPPIDVCKMDVEGAEAIALRGMRRTLARSPNMKLLVEYAGRFSGSNELLALLRSEFSSISVIGSSQLGDFDSPPEYCNLWANH